MSTYLDELMSAARDVQNVQLNILREKHDKYGNKPILKSGHDGIVAKIDMKLERYRNLWDNAPNCDSTPEEVAEWSADMVEQFRDIANYCTLAELLLSNRMLQLAKKWQS